MVMVGKCKWLMGQAVFVVRCRIVYQRHWREVINLSETWILLFLYKISFIKWCTCCIYLLYLWGHGFFCTMIFLSTVYLAQVQLLHTLHENGGMTSAGPQIYVTGGHWHGMAREYSVVMESYDSSTDIWTREGALPSRWMYHCTSAIFMDTSRWPRIFQGQSQMEVWQNIYSAESARQTLQNLLY